MHNKLKVCYLISSHMQTPMNPPPQLRQWIHPSPQRLPPHPQAATNQPHFGLSRILKKWNHSVGILCLPSFTQPSDSEVWACIRTSFLWLNSTLCTRTHQFRLSVHQFADVGPRGYMGLGAGTKYCGCHTINTDVPGSSLRFKNLNPPIALRWGEGSC